MVDKKHRLPHSRLVLEEGRQGGVVAVPRGWQRGEQVASRAVLLARALCLPWSWCGMPAREGGQHHMPRCYFTNQFLGK